MYKLFIKKLIASTFLSSIALTFPQQVLADKLDLQKDVVIQAKRQAGDLKNKIASYLDDVVITQGSLKIKADIVQVISQSDSDNKTYVAKGKPATFTQLLEDGSPINLQADEIRYEPSLNLITIIGDAKLSQAGSEVTGSKITYNTLTEQLSAESNSDGITKTILKPQEQKKDKN